MLISIGILAYNEADVIEQTITSLFSQTVFSSEIDSLRDVLWEIVVVPNGCSDNTSEKSFRALERLVDSNEALGNVRWSVRDIAEPGKSNAWNRFVHEFSSPVADVIVMIDADIEFRESATIFNCVSTLLSDPHAVVVVDQPLKDVVKKASKTLMERLSLAVSETKKSDPPAIAGSFYCARASALRDVYMPRGLSSEDGFLRAMLITDCFRHSVDESRVVRAENASHYYETLTAPSEIFRHELRMKIGSALNCYLCWDLLYLATDPEGPGAGVTIRNQVAIDPNWYNRIVHNAIKNRGWWVLPRGMLFGRIARASKTVKIRGRLKAIFVALIVFPFDLLVSISANQKLKNKTSIGYW